MNEKKKKTITQPEKNTQNSPDKRTGSAKATRAKKVDLKIGDEVMFTGSIHYTGPDDKRGLPCKAGRAILTAFHPNGVHPFHLIRKPAQGATVYGWVDADCISKP